MKKERTGSTLQEGQRVHTLTDFLEKKKRGQRMRNSEKDTERQRQTERQNANNEDRETAMSPVFTKNREVSSVFLNRCPVPVSQIPCVTVISF